MKPRYYQSAAEDAAWKFLAEQRGNPLTVLPTGAGKSLVIAMIAKQAVEFGARVVVLQHRKELIQQNTEKIQILIPDIKIGIYSAGLKSRQCSEDIVCVGIQSVYRKAIQLGRREMLIIDEAHLVSSDDETMYGQFLSDVRAANPKARVVGLTATPFRTGEGPICGKGKLFSRICYEIETGKLIDEGFLCPITNKPADAMVDTSLIETRGGEFIEQDMQAAFNTEDNVVEACKEIVAKCHDRKSVLIFCSGVNHAAEVSGWIEKLTMQTVGIVTGETLPMERAATLSAFKRGELRWLVNCDVLTTGFDAPCIDAICVLRATLSPGLFAQMVGRGLRKHESKQNCLILDFGENIKRHGSLDDANYGRFSVAASSKPSAADNNGRGKQCPNCEQDVAAKSTECDDCGFVFPVVSRHGMSSDSESQLTGAPEPEVWQVGKVTWARHTKKGGDGPPTLRIDYECVKQGERKALIHNQCKDDLCESTEGEYQDNGPHIELICAKCKRHQMFVKKTEVQHHEGGFMKQTISEWVCLSHEGFARTKACLWWQARSIAPVPLDVYEGVEMMDRGACREPATITTTREGKYFRIKSVEFAEDKPEAWRDADEPLEVLSDGGEFDGFDEVPF